MIDFLLILMAVFWGANYSIVKNVFREIDPQAFNALRMSLGSLIFLTVIVGVRVRASRGGRIAGPGGVFYTPAKMTTRDWWGLAGLGLIGHCCYQYTFIAGLSRTSVANSSLMLGATPVLVALLSALLGIDRIGRLHWAGAALSMTGIYLVVGKGFSLGSHGATGDLLMIAAVCCWAIYTIGARPLMMRHSPVGVTGTSMIMGTVMYLPVAWPHLAGLRLSTISASTWAALLLLGSLRRVCFVHDLVCGRPEAGNRPDVHLLELRPNRGDAERRDRAARATRHAQDPGGRRRPRRSRADQSRAAEVSGAAAGEGRLGKTPAGLWYN